MFSIDGDFMLGRFFTAPFAVGAALLARAAWVQYERRAGLVAVGVIAAGLVAPWEPALLSGIGYASVRTRLVGPPSTDPCIFRTSETGRSPTSVATIPK